jgi:ankyrin repeat protein
VKALVEAGADVDALSFYGDTPLHLCVTSCNVTSAETLLRAGANPNPLNKKGLSPLVAAQQRGCNSITQLLQDWGKKE